MALTTRLLGLPETVRLPMPRCDRCAAAGPIRVVTTQGELTFCRHHGKIHAARLRHYPHVIITSDRRVVFPGEDWWDKFAQQPCACSPGCQVNRHSRW